MPATATTAPAAPLTPVAPVSPAPQSPDALDAPQAPWGASIRRAATHWLIPSVHASVRAAARSASSTTTKSARAAASDAFAQPAERQHAALRRFRPHASPACRDRAPAARAESHRPAGEPWRRSAARRACRPGGDPPRRRRSRRRPPARASTARRRRARRRSAPAAVRHDDDAVVADRRGRSRGSGSRGARRAIAASRASCATSGVLPVPPTLRLPTLMTGARRRRRASGWRSYQRRRIRAVCA